MLRIDDLPHIRQLLSRMIIPAIELSLDFKILYANNAALDTMGISLASIRNGLNILDLVVPEQVDLLTLGIENIKNGANPIPLTLRILRIDGIQIPVQAYTDLIYDKSDNLVGLLVYLFDMTRYEHIARKTEEQHEAFRILTESSQFGALIVDEHYRFLYVNDAFCSILGRQRNEVLGHDFREFLHPESVDLVTDRYVRRQRGEKVPSMYKFKVLRKDGSVRIVLLNSHAMHTQNGSVRTVAHIHDITETERQREQLEASELRYRTLVETMVTGLGIDDVNGNLIYANPALIKMLGYSSMDEMVGMPLHEIFSGWSEEVVKERNEQRRRGVVESYEAFLIHRTGRLIPVMVNASPLFDPSGNYIGSFGLVTDISDIKRAEAEVHFLLDLLLHDFGNQLQLVIAGAELYHPTSSTEVLETARGYILDGARRCLELISKVRKIEQAKGELVRPIDLVDVLLTEIEHISRQYQVTPSVEGITGRVMVQADSSLSNLFWNIMENAIKHNPNEDKRLWIKGWTQDNEFHLEFADNGTGLSDSKKAQLFLSTRRYGGVGLHLVKNLVAKYGARLLVDDRVPNNPGQGLKITVIFPIIEDDCV